LIAGTAIFAAAASAQQFGTADEAKAMLAKTVSALKADKSKTLDLINEGKGGFLDRDLYPFCFNLSDGKSVAVASPRRRSAIAAILPTIEISQSILRFQDHLCFIYQGLHAEAAVAFVHGAGGQFFLSKRPA
jgi:hypothetical protein